MKVTAKLNYLRIAPRKVRLVVDLIRKKKVEEAQTILNFTVKKASQPLLKLLNSAVANAKNDFQLDSANLYIYKITVDEGRKYKRWRPRARGRASQILKRTSNITLVLEEIKPTKKARKVKKAKPKVTEKETKEVKKAVKEIKEVKEEKEIREFERVKPKPEIEKPRPKIVRGIKRIFKRKAF